MSSELYDKGREGILDRTINMTGDVRACLVRSNYIFSNTHIFLSSIGININGRTPAFKGKTYTNGIFDADDTNLFAEGSYPCNAIVIYQHTGNDETSRLIAYIGSAESGLPFTPAAGQRIDIKWDDGPNKIFRL